MSVGTTAAVIGAVGAGTSLLGGIFGAHAAKSAAQIQAEAAANAGKEVTDAVAATNPEVTAAATKAGQQVIDTSKDAATGVYNVTGQANNLLNPYAKAGSVAADALEKGIAPGGDFNKTPTKEDIQIDPGFAYRQQQAEQALERSAAAHGGVDNGGYLRDLNKEVQGSASQEYQAAFNRFITSQQSRYNNVFGVAGLGKDASATMGANLIGAGKYGGDTSIAASRYAGDNDLAATNLTTGRTVQGANTDADYKTQGANAQAAGKVAGSNAIWGGVNGAVGAVGNAFALDQLQKNPNMFNPAIRASANTRTWVPPNGANILTPQQVRG